MNEPFKAPSLPSIPSKQLRGSTFVPETFLKGILPWLVGGWTLGVSLLVTRLWISWLCLRRLAAIPLPKLSVEWQCRLELLCRSAKVYFSVRMGETTAVVAPIMIGWFRPVILLPLGVLSQLPTEQVEAILYHELVHIRRHDFLVNLLQCVIETLFFYHPAVRRFSHQIREERERICDDLSIEWCQSPLIYAEALTTFEEHRQQSLALLLTGDGDLLLRVRRIIGTESKKRTVDLFAFAGILAAAFYLASMFLVPLFAAELMTDEERVAEIKALQPPPNPGNSFAPSENVSVTGTLKTDDGQPLPKSLFNGPSNLKPSEAKVTSSHGGVRSMGGLALDSSSPTIYYGNTQTGQIQLGVWAEGYAPLQTVILQDRGGRVTMDLTLKHGFPASVQVLDPSGQPLDGVTLTARHGEYCENSMPSVITDTQGRAIFGNVEANSEIRLSAFKSGWQMATCTVSQWNRQTPFVFKLTPARLTIGRVLDRASHRSIEGADIILAARRATGDSYAAFDPESGQLLGRSSENGRFTLYSLAQNPGYYIYVRALRYPIQSFPISYGEQDRVCELESGIDLRGRILDPKGLLKLEKYPINLEARYTLQATPFNGFGQEKRQTLAKLGAEIPFEFDNLPQGPIEISFANYGLENYRYSIDLQKNIDDYVINLNDTPPLNYRNPVDTRTLSNLNVSLKNDSDVVSGILDGEYSSKAENEKWNTSQSAIISAGKATFSLPVPTTVGLYPDHLIGYWFAPQTFDLTEAKDSSRSISVLKAGVIHGKVNLSPQFTNQFLSIIPVVIQPPPGIVIKNLTSGTVKEVSAKSDYLTQPLPFGGIYAVIILDASPSYFITSPAQLDAEHPIAVRDFVLQPPPSTIEGQFIDENDKPVSYREVMLTYHPTGSDYFMSHCATTNVDGKFIIAGVNFDLPGYYEVQIYGHDYKSTNLRIDSHTKQPIVIVLHRLE